MMVKRGLYAITPDISDTASLLDTTDRILQAGAVMLQYRNKTASPALRLEQARALGTLCRNAACPLIINDDIELARNVQAAGVHLGQDDDPVEQARAVLGPDSIIGVTCHASIELADTATAQGASYVAFGRFFPSNTKPDAPPADSGILALARLRLDIPLVAIGGVTADNAAHLIEAGADLLAVGHGVFGARDPGGEAALYEGLFSTSGQRA